MCAIIHNMFLLVQRLLKNYVPCINNYMINNAVAFH